MMTNLLVKTRAFFDKRQTQLRTEPLFCALSGGSDSVALALVLRSHQLPFTALHCNFLLRGSESDRDETFVREFCQRHDIPLKVKHFDVPAVCAETRESVEMAARRLRYEWFAEHQGAIFVAHHANDNAETLLLNLVRGTGLRGLSGMQLDNGAGILRPFLNVRHDEILQYLESEGEDFVTDSTNADTEIRRNFLRNKVLPMLEQLNPSVVDTLSETIQRLYAAETVYETGLLRLAESYAPAVDGDKQVFPLRQIKAGGVAAHTWCYEALKPFGFSGAAVGDMLNARSGAQFFSETHQACVHRDTLEVATLLVPPIPDFRSRQYARTPTFSVSRSPHCATLDADKVVGKVVLRRCIEGDRFSPFGMRRGTKLVSDYLTDHYRSRIDKQRALVLCDDVGIIWLVGETIDRRVEVSKSTTRIFEVEL